MVVKEILLALLMEKGFDITKQHMDCGIEIFDAKRQKTDAGGSGCVLPKPASGTVAPAPAHSENGL